MTDPERAMRFGYLLSEIEIGARRILDGTTNDITVEMIAIRLAYDEAWGINVEVSREALDKVVNEE